MRPGTLLGERYRLDACLGIGNVGQTWKAYDTTGDKVVAVKLVHEHLAADEEFRRHFKRQSLTAASIHSDYIVDVLEYNEESLDDGGGHRFTVMEYVEAKPLADVLDERWRLDSADGARLLRDIASGLEAAHAAGLVHGRLHTRNILVDADGRARITDFGTDMGGSDPLALIPRGASAGVSPEQLSGEPATASSDVYAAGAIGFEALSGVALFASTEPSDIREGHLRDTPPELPETVDGAVRTVVKRCLAKRPAARFAAASELLEAIAAALYDIENPRALVPVPKPVRPVVWQNPRPSPGGRTRPTTVVDGRIVPREVEPLPPKKSGKRLWLLGAVALAAAIIAGSIFLLPTIIQHTGGSGGITGNAANQMDESQDGTDPDGPGSANGSHGSGSDSSADASDSDSSGSSSSSGAHHHKPSHHPSSHSSSHSSSKPPEVEVPSVVGLSYKSARDALDAKGFDITVNYSGSGHVECDVSDQNPNAGDMAPKGSRVEVTIKRVDNHDDCGDGGNATP